MIFRETSLEFQFVPIEIIHNLDAPSIYAVCTQTNVSGHAEVHDPQVENLRLRGAFASDHKERLLRLHFHPLY